MVQSRVVTELAFRAPQAPPRPAPAGYPSRKRVRASGAEDHCDPRGAPSRDPRPLIPNPRPHLLSPEKQNAARRLIGLGLVIEQMRFLPVPAGEHGKSATGQGKRQLVSADRTRRGARTMKS